MRHVIVTWGDKSKKAWVSGETKTHITTGPGTFVKKTGRHILWGFSGDRRGIMEYKEVNDES